MKFYTTIVAVIIAFLPITANATVVDFGDPITGLPDINGYNGVHTFADFLPNQTGTIFTTPGASNGLAEGYIPNNHKITFSYSFSNATLYDPSTGTGNLLYMLGGDAFNSIQVSHSSNDLLPPVAGFEVFAAANISGTSGTTSFTNTSGIQKYFVSYFSGILESVANGQGGFVGKINYSVSAVPLPASVLMFGTALIFMAAFSYKQRKASILAV
ncbi:MAG: hypothetical protein ABL867_11150 [Rickettsiales bacterium]